MTWGFNVWFGIFGTHKIGDYFFNILDSKGYFKLVQTHVTEHHIGCRLAALQQMFFQQDDAPPHNAQIIRNFLIADSYQQVDGNHGLARWLFNGVTSKIKVLPNIIVLYMV